MLIKIIFIRDASSVLETRGTRGTRGKRGTRVHAAHAAVIRQMFIKGVPRFSVKATWNFVYICIYLRHTALHRLQCRHAAILTKKTMSSVAEARGYNSKENKSNVVCRGGTRL